VGGAARAGLRSDRLLARQGRPGCDSDDRRRGANGGNSGGYLLALDFETGAVHWDQRAQGQKAPKGAVAFADARLYYRTEDGPVLLIEPSPKEYLERGRFEQPGRSGKPAWAHPVIANGRLYLRDQDLLLAYDIRTK
jgi:hypothetical protein